MGRKPRRQHERCKLPDAKRTGSGLAWLVVVLVTAWQTASPTLCREAPPMVASDGGSQEHPAPVSAEALADAAWGGTVVAVFPGPATGQKRPPCPWGAKEASGGCWKRTDSRPPCDYFEVEDGGACYMGIPERPKGRAVAGDD